MKTFLVVGLLVILSMVLAACGGAGADMTPTAVGGVGSDPIGTEVDGTLPSAEPMETEEPLATGVGGGGVDLTPVGTVMGTNIPATGDQDNNRLSNLLDFTVVDAQNNELGEVDDMVIDAAGTQVQYVIVGSGGFLGIGERDLLIPWSMVEVGTNANNDAVFVFNGDADALRNAPDVDVDDIDFTIKDWDVDVDTYWANPGAFSATPIGTAVVDNVQTTPDAMQATASVEVGDDDDDDNYSRGQAANSVLASKLIIADVVDLTTYAAGDGAVGTGVPNVQAQPTAMSDAGTPVAGDVDATSGAPEPIVDADEIGEVVDAILDPASGVVEYLVVNAEDGLNLGNVWIPIPMSHVELVYKGDDDGNFVVLVPSDRLGQAPNFEDDMLPNTSMDDWDTDLVTYWGITR